VTAKFASTRNIRQRHEPIMTTHPTTSKHTVRPLTADDRERVIAIDRAHSGLSRRSFFDKRFAAAKAHPEDFVAIGVTFGGSLCGFATARVLRGEFGGAQTVATLDGLGVAVGHQEHGLGLTLIAELSNELRRREVRSLQSQVAWTNSDLLRFFATSDFVLAPRLALERSVVAPFDEEHPDV